MVPLSAEVLMRPTNSVQVTGSAAQQVLRLMRRSKIDDVASVAANRHTRAEMEAAG
jgi:hypothetical protein